MQFGGIRPANAFHIRLWPFQRWPKRQQVAARRKRILILMSDTGGGHRASAQALRDGFQMEYGDQYQVDIVDIWTHHTPYPFNQLPKTYSFLVRHPFIWRFGYYLQQPKLVHMTTQTAAAAVSNDLVGEAFDHYRPDLVVSVHPLMQQMPLKVLRMRIRNGLQRPIHFATVVTDLTTCHNTWFHKGVSKCFVPTREAAQCGLNMGLKRTQLVMHGLPIRPAFSGRMPRQDRLRKRLGLAHEAPAVLLVGGGEGMGAIADTVNAIARHLGSACQLVVVCGRNKKLVQALQSRTYPEGMNVLVQGFVDNMEQWMLACDVIVTKAGPGTIAESLICGLPILLNGFIPCQEAGNVPFVVDNKVGAYEKDPDALARILRLWLADAKGEFEAMRQRAIELGEHFKGGLFRIVHDLARLAEQSGRGCAPAFAKFATR